MMAEEKKTPQNEKPAKGKGVPRPSDKYIPWLFVLFFVVLSLLLGYFVYLATSTSRGLVTEDAYNKGLAYNAVVEKQKMQDALGWGSELLVDKKPGKPAKIRFMLRDKSRAPIKDATVQIVFVRPVEAGHDVTLLLKMDEPGVYRGEADLPLPGLWESHVSVQIGKDTYQVSDRHTLP